MKNFFRKLCLGIILIMLLKVGVGFIIYQFTPKKTTTTYYFEDSLP
jgi:hypothetical protein